MDEGSAIPRLRGEWARDVFRRDAARRMLDRAGVIFALNEGGALAAGVKLQAVCDAVASSAFTPRSTITSATASRTRSSRSAT